LPARQQRLGASIAAGILALILGGWTLVHTGGAGTVPPGVMFFLFGGVAVVGAICMITQHNPVYAALWFAVVIISVCGLFLLQAASFLAAATIIVYAGAIIVTFLFVIMLAQQSGYAVYDRRAREPLLATLAGFVLLGALLEVLEKTYAAPTEPARVADRLLRVRQLIDAKATDKQIDDAMYLSGNRPVMAVLQEEILRVPSDVWPTSKKDDVMLRFEAAQEKWAAGKTAPAGRNPAQMEEAVTTLQQIAQELATAGPHPSTLPIPEQVRQTVGGVGRESAGQYVAGLGRSLFGEYLYAVELAGELLLIATIGAIAIAFRRKEATP
jgi:NADH:ubiquinone oxidoreductase subunit 6 (subunit J)